MMAENGTLTNQDFIGVVNALSSRLGLASQMGSGFGGDRDIYLEAGWKRELSFEDFMALYARNGVSTRIIDLPVKGTWNDSPDIVDDPESVDNTSFMDRIRKLDRSLRIFNKMARADRLARIGEYAVLLIGAGNDDLEQPLVRATELAYLKPYSKQQVTWKENDLVSDRNDPDFGLPNIYELDVKGIGKRRVHRSRIIHIAEDPIDDELLGTPALRSSFNWLFVLDMVIAGAGEGYWQTGFPGRQAVADADAQMTDGDRDRVQEQIDEFIHGLRKWFTLQGVRIDSIGGSPSDPTSLIGTLLDLIAGASGIPKRLLTGSERGELASSQDHATLASLIRSRRQYHVGPNIIRPFIDRLVDIGILPSPVEDEYEIDWLDPYQPSESERAETAKTKAEAVRAAFGAAQAPLVIPFRQFMDELNWDPSIEPSEEDDLDDEQDEIDEDTEPDNESE